MDDVVISDVVLVALIGAIGSIITVISAAVLSKARQTHDQVRQTHNLVNSRMDRLLELTETAARAQGVLDEKEKHQ